MKRILVSGNVNLETNVWIDRFPLEYQPVRYHQFGILTDVGGVAYNVSKALSTLGDDVSLVAMLGPDMEGEQIKSTLKKSGIQTTLVKDSLFASPKSVILHDEEGKRAIFTDTKNLQTTLYDFDTVDLYGLDLIVACNVNFNRSLLHKAHEAGIPMATDVHVLSNPYDDYNEAFMKYANIIFLSDEGVSGSKNYFIETLRLVYPAEVIVMGLGKDGALIYLREEDCIYHLSAVYNNNVINTIGAGDALFSSFLHFYINGDAPIEALKKAQIFASYKISFNGASKGFITEEELENLAKDTVITVTKCE